MSLSEWHLSEVPPGLQDTNSVSLHGIQASRQSGPACLLPSLSTVVHDMLCTSVMLGYFWIPTKPWNFTFSFLLLVILQNTYILQDSTQNVIICFLPVLFQISICIAQLASTCIYFINSVHVWSILYWECF